MANLRVTPAWCILAAAMTLAPPAAFRAHGQVIRGDAVDRWITVTEGAAGTGMKAQDEALAAALRKAVEQACGVFLTSQSKTKDYQAVYDRVFANAVGYVIEHKTLKTWEKEGITYVEVRARVSTQKFAESWANIAHTLDQENNPRVIIAIAEATRWTTTGPAYKVEEAGIVQGKIEDFFLSKGLQLMDRAAGIRVSKRDIMLAGMKDDTAEVAAIGARFKADVIIVGQAWAKYGRMIRVGDQEMHQYTATLVIRAVRTDSAQLIVSKTLGPLTANTLQVGGGEDKALVKLAEDSAPKVLSAVVEAWRKQINVKRNIELNISGMDYKTWKVFEEEAKALRGVQALRRREITEGVATIDVEYSYSVDSLADRLGELKSVKLEVVEITANRIKLKMTGGPAKAQGDKEGNAPQTPKEQ